MVVVRGRSILRAGSFCAICLLLLRGDAVAVAEVPNYHRQILPLLAERCGDCHGQDVTESSLSVTALDRLLLGGDSGPAIVPGSASRSLLFERVNAGEMPPDDPLSAEQVELLRTWIDSGAPADESSADSVSAASNVAAAEVFTRVFFTHCISCHGKHKQEAGLDLRTPDSLRRGGKSGPAIVPGDPQSSLIVQKLVADDMPPRTSVLGDTNYVRRVSPEDIELIKEWIAAGAQADPDPPPRTDSPAPSKFWSFQPLRRPAVPTVGDTPAVHNPIDEFVAAQLETHNLRIAPEASKEQLIRRAYFDLIGLPPTPPEIIDFLVDTTAGAFERMIDRLLASPHYGERWGQHWLDAIGYADSHGKIDRDQFRPYMWRYRDYVIQSLNADKPFDRFLTEQIAGDELLEAEPPSDSQRGVQELVATGFWLMAADATDEAAFNFVPQRMGVVAEQVDIFSSAVMGLSMECARCHNHKFDPISQSDYYRFSAILQSALDPYDWRLSSQLLYPRKSPIDRAYQRYLYVDEGPESPELARHNAPLRERLQQLQTELEEETLRARGSMSQDAAAGQPLSADELAARLPEFKAKRDPLLNQIAAIQIRILEPGVIAGLRDMGGEPTPVYLLRRGDPLAAGVRVEPDVPRALQPIAGPYHVELPAPGSQSSGNRLALARWLTNPRHPLTARVFVNRVWQQHFGQGIVSTPGNFGEMGARPTHPELLDWLASEFVENGWSLKHLHRLIMTSSTYRQSSQVSEEQLARDADNRWLSRYPLRRLDGESVRDSTLAVSGQLDVALFGPPIEVERTPEGEVIEANPKSLRRRSIYLAKMRMKPLTLIEQFDGPELVPNCLLRTHSTVAPQALQLYNGPFVREAAAVLAHSLVSAGRKTDAEHVEYLYLALFGRRPTAVESTSATQWIAQLRNAWRRNAAAAAHPATAPSPDEETWTSYCHVLLNSPEFLYLD